MPSDDPFYEPPAGFEHAEPGTVLRSRDVQLGFLGLIPQRVRATQLLYRTTDHNGLPPQATVTTVLIPTGHTPPDQVRNVVSYQCAIDAVASRCFPSYAMRRHAKPSAHCPPSWSICSWRPRWPRLGGVRSGPRGSGRHLGVPPLRTRLRRPGRFAGRARFRAVRSRRGQPDRAVGGYSGGGLASAWAAEMHEDYAPELNLVGAVLGSPVGDLGHTFRKLNGSYLAALPALVVSALAKTYPDLNRVIEQNATEEGLALLRRLEKDDDRGGRHPVVPHRLRRPGAPAAGRDPGDARGAIRLRQHQTGQGRPPTFRC